MDGLMVIVGAVILLVAGVVLLAVGLSRLVQRLERRYPDTAMPVLRSFVHRGCDSDHKKYLQCQAKLAGRRIEREYKRYKALRAAIAAMDGGVVKDNVTPMRRRLMPVTQLSLVERQMGRPSGASTVQADPWDDAGLDDTHDTDSIFVSPEFHTVLKTAAAGLAVLFTLLAAIGAVTVGRWLAEWGS